MSTGAPVSSVDTISPTLSTQGHYKPTPSRGHSRSKRWSQGPISYSASDAASTQQSSQPLTGPTDVNGNASSSSHGHQHSHSHSSSHGEPWGKFDHANGLHTHISKHSHSGSVTGLVPDTPIVSSNPESLRTHEMFAGALIASPWIAISWYYTHHAQWTESQPAIDNESFAPSGTGHLDHIPLRTCILTAITMIILGGGQLLRVAQRDRRDSLVALPKLHPTTVTASFAQMSSIALPIYAALKVGGFLVAFVLTLAMSSGVPTIARGYDFQDNENMHGIFLHILADTLGSVAVVISTILVHYSGWSGYDPIASCMIAGLAVNLVGIMVMVTTTHTKSPTPMFWA